MAAPAKQGPGRCPQDRTVAQLVRAPLRRGSRSRGRADPARVRAPGCHPAPAGARRGARWRDSRRGRRARRRARAADRSRAPRLASPQCRPAPRTADWKRGHRPALGALFRPAQRSAAKLISVPMPHALGSSESSASSSAPAPVPRSTMRSARDFRSSQSSAASAASTTVSVSGRGSRVSALTLSGSPQNSLRPRMRATGSRASRRAESAAMAPASSAASLRLDWAASAVWSSPSAWPTMMRASSSGASRPPRRNSRASRRRAASIEPPTNGSCCDPASVRAGRVTTARPLPPAIPPGARSRARR